MIFVGIDPGLDGAVAVLYGDKRARVVFVPKHTTVLSVPTVKVGKRREYDVPAMIRYLVGDTRRFDPAESIVIALEHVHAFPGQGVVSMWRMGYGSGLWTGIVTALGYRVELVTPQRWKKAMLDGLPKGKGSSLLQARRLFPGLPITTHGQADAVLIAEWARRTWGTK